MAIRFFSLCRAAASAAAASWPLCTYGIVLSSSSAVDKDRQLQRVFVFEHVLLAILCINCNILRIGWDTMPRRRYIVIIHASNACCCDSGITEKHMHPFNGIVQRAAQTKKAHISYGYSVQRGCHFGFVFN